MMSNLGNLYVHVEYPGQSEAASTGAEIALLMAVSERLSLCTREVYMLRKLKRVPPKEIAAMLEISRETVEVHIGRANRYCEEFLRNHGVIRREIVTSNTGKVILEKSNLPYMALDGEIMPVTYLMALLPPKYENHRFSMFPRFHLERYSLAEKNIGGWSAA